MSIPQLLAHNKRDNVGVVVVEGLAAGADYALCDYRKRFGVSFGRPRRRCNRA